MYDMSRVNANGYFDAMSADDRYKLREQLNAELQRGNHENQRIVIHQYAAAHLY